MLCQPQSNGELRRLPPKLFLVRGDQEFLIKTSELARVGHQCLDLLAWGDEDMPR